MRVEMLMPQMGESITEAKILKWNKAVGDKVEKDEIVLEISTDKVDSEIPAPAAGTLAQICCAVGSVVPVRTKIAVIETGVDKSLTTKEPRSPAAPAVTKNRADRFYSPLVKNLAAQHKITEAELAEIPGSGQGGRVSKEDILSYLENRRLLSRNAEEDTTVVPMDNMRLAIAEHMVRSKHTSPHVYSIQEVDVTALLQWRASHQEEFEKKEGFRLSVTPFFLEATVTALKRFPYLNALVEEKKILLKKHINLGCAVALDNGLIVPVIKHAETKTLTGLARSVQDLAARARQKKLLPEEVLGGTFTVTNTGTVGTLIGTPIINQPQVAILCIGAITKRPAVINDTIAIREMCYITLTYDHRIIDGATGGKFLAEIKSHLEAWSADRVLQ
jgi:2-oxoglutarate dehydrogenase E2 component (dihydrolipoamide succinyltransferase)